MENDKRGLSGRRAESPPAYKATPPPALAPITPASPSANKETIATPSSMLSKTVSATPKINLCVSNLSDASSGRSSMSSCSQVYVPPSPSRARLDPQYAARLVPQKRSASTSMLPPPGIVRNTKNASIFRPPPIDTTFDTESLSPSGSLFETPERIARSFSPSMRSFSPGMSSRGLQSPKSFGSLTSSVGTPRRYTTMYSAGNDTGYSDRFIPSRATSNMNFSLWDGSPKRLVTNNSNASGDMSEASNDERGNNVQDDTADASAGGSARSTDATNNASQPLFNVLLRSELLGENLDPSPPSPRPSQSPGSSPPRSTSTPLREFGNHFRYRSPRQAYQNSIFDEPSNATSVVNSFSLTPIGSATSQRLMSTPQKQKRRISKVPFKVLDAPALQDDFYLNLVDWSSQNVLAVGLGSCVYLWSACTSKVTKLCDLAQSEDIVTSVSWAQRGTHLAVGTNRGEVQLWDTIKCKKVRTMPGHSARIGTLSWSGPTLASGSRDRLIYLRDVRIQPPFTARLASHKQEVCGLKWSFDEPSNLASGGNDNKLLVWDVKNTSVPVHRFADHTAAVKAIAWSPHQHGLLASGGGTADRCIRFWNTLSGTNLSCVDTGSQVCNLAWSQNCNEIVSTHGYSLNQIVVWRYPSMSKVVTLTGHTYRVLYLAMSPDGSTIVTGAGDETLRFWQVFPGPRSHDKSSGNGLLFPNMPGSVVR